MNFKKSKVGIQWFILAIITTIMGIIVMKCKSTQDESVFSSILGGLVWIFLGDGALIINLLLNKKINKLIENNKYIICTDIKHEFKEIGQIEQGDKTIEPVYGYYTKCTYIDEFGKTYEFESEKYENKEKNPFDNMTEIYVFVDLENEPDFYYMYPYNV